MPKIAEIKRVDGALWVRVDTSGDTGSIGLYTPDEIKTLTNTTLEDAAREVESAGGDSTEFHARCIRELKSL